MRSNSNINLIYMILGNLLGKYLYGLYQIFGETFYFAGPAIACCAHIILHVHERFFVDIYHEFIVRILP